MIRFLSPNVLFFLQRNGAIMIVTVQFVFCFLKEVFQSLLFQYHEGHSSDQERMVEDVINEQGE